MPCQIEPRLRIREGRQTTKHAKFAKASVDSVALCEMGESGIAGFRISDFLTSGGF